MTTLNNASQWEFDAPKFYDFTKQESPNEQVDSWFAKRSAPFSRHIRPAYPKRTKETATRIPRTDANKPTENDTTTTTTTSSSSRSTAAAAAPKKRVDIFDALASTPTIASAAKRTTTSSDKRSYQQLPPPPPPLSSAKPETTTTETPSKKQPSSSALPSRVPRLPARVPTQDGRIHLQSKDNEPTSIEDSRSRRSLTKEQQSLTKDNEKNDENQLNEQQRIPTDENVPPASSSSSIQHPMTTTDEDDRISLSLTDFNAIFNRVEDMRTQIAQMTSTETSKQQGVDKATAITPPKTITRPAGPNITAIEGRIQRARKAMRESLAITERWFQSTEQELSSSASLSYLPSRKLSQISKWRHDTADDFSDSLPARRQPYSTLHSDVDDTATTRSTSTHRSRTSRGFKRMAPTYLRPEPTIPKSPKFATDSRHARSSH